MSDITTVVTRNDFLRSSEFNFLVNCWYRHDQIFDTQEYRIEDAALVRFKILYKESKDVIQAQISSRKLRGQGPVTLHLTTWQTQGNKPSQKHKHELNIERDWIEFRNIGKFESHGICKDVLVFTFVLSIKVQERKMLVDSASFFDDTDFTDFELTSADGGRVQVHRLILAAHSDMFKTMLTKEWKETNESCIEIKGADLQTLQHLKEFMYLGIVPGEGLLTLLMIAKCYLIEKLKTECINVLADTVNPEDVYDLLEFAHVNMIPELAFAIFQFTPMEVIRNASNFKKSVEKAVEPQPAEIQPQPAENQPQPSTS